MKLLQGFQSSWQAIAFTVMVIWGFYGVFSNKATALHGARNTMLFEGICMLAVAIYAVAPALGELGKITPKSALYGLITGLASAVGVYMAFKAYGVAPERGVEITTITCSFFLATALIVAIVAVVKPEWMSEFEPLTPIKWVGVLFTVIGLVLVNWNPVWNEKLKAFLRL